MTRAKLNTEIMLMLLAQNQTLINLQIQDMRVNGNDKRKLAALYDKSEQIKLLNDKNDELNN